MADGAGTNLEKILFYGYNRVGALMAVPHTTSKEDRPQDYAYQHKELQLPEHTKSASDCLVYQYYHNICFQIVYYAKSMRR